MIPDDLLKRNSELQYLLFLGRTLYNLIVDREIVLIRKNSKDIGIPNKTAKVLGEVYTAYGDNLHLSASYSKKEKNLVEVFANDIKMFEEYGDIESVKKLVEGWGKKLGNIMDNDNVLQTLKKRYKDVGNKYTKTTDKLVLETGKKMYNEDWSDFINRRKKDGER